MSKFDECLAVGRGGEQTFSTWLQSRGWLIFPAYEKATGDFKGPQLFSADGDLILPDMLALKDGKAIWCEVKRKSCFSWNRNKQRWVTGIDLHHYEQYKMVAIRTRIPVWLIFYHPEATPSDNDLSWGSPATCPSGLFGHTLRHLSKNECHRDPRHAKGMVYWWHETLKELK